MLLMTILLDAMKLIVHPSLSPMHTKIGAHKRLIPLESGYMPQKLVKSSNLVSDKQSSRDGLTRVDF